jgi:type IV pilus assembly protein PilA
MTSHTKFSFVRGQVVANQQGFSLIELLIVVAIILIIAAIAIPSLLQSKISANEAAAATTVRQLKTAEVMYFNTYPTIGYSADLKSLGGSGNPCVPNPAAACAIDSSLAAASAAPGKDGYFYNATGIANGGFNGAFVAAASPITLSKTGNRSFCSTGEGSIRFNYVGGPPVTSLAACDAFPGSLP